MIDELLEMQKDTFKGLLLVTWIVSLAALWISLFALIYLAPVQVLIWAAVSPLNLIAYRLAFTRFRLATWVWVCSLLLLLVFSIPWHLAPAFGPIPYGFILMVA